MSLAKLENSILQCMLFHRLLGRSLEQEDQVQEALMDVLLAMAQGDITIDATPTKSEISSG